MPLVDLDAVPSARTAIVPCIWDNDHQIYVSATSYRGVELCEKYNADALSSHTVQAGSESVGESFQALRAETQEAGR